MTIYKRHFTCLGFYILTFVYVCTWIHTYIQSQEKKEPAKLEIILELVYIESAVFTLIPNTHLIAFGDTVS